MTLQIDVLGRFAVHRGGRQVPRGRFGGQLAQRLVRVLALRRGELVTRDALIEALWGGQSPADPEANLNVLINRARRGLGDPAVIETAAHGYLLTPSAGVTVDAEQFAAGLHAAREAMDRGQPDRALAAVRSALALWRGDPLPEDTYADWARPHRDRLERLRQDALELGAAAALATGDPPHAADLAWEAVTCQPLREAAHLLHIRALAACGDVAAALAAYDTLRRRLADELGIDPSREAAELHLRLLRGDTATPATQPAPAGPAQAAAGVPFVGREQEVASLRGLGGEQRVGLVGGASGAGKSRLLAEVAAGGDRQVLTARAVLPERDAPWSLARALLRAAVGAGGDPEALLPPRSRAALADLLPELDASGSPGPIDAQSRRALALEAAARLVAAVPRALVVVDDLQWADASSLRALAVIGSRAEDAAIILAYRPEEVPPGHEVATFLADVRATTRPLELRLGVLDTAAVQRLTGDAGLAEVLVKATDGTPFAVLEALRALEQQGAVRRDGHAWRPAGPDVLDRARAQARAGHRRSILLRADRQAADRRELLDLLALLGRPAPEQLLVEATGLAPAEVSHGLHELTRAGLVRHLGRGWAAAHDLVGETLREHLDAGGRARLHQLLARALEHDRAAAGERAGHLAGAGDHPAAAAVYAQAARERLERFADREAEQLAEAGLRLDPAGPTRPALLEVRAQTRFRAGDLAGARSDLRAALTLTRAAPDRSRLLTLLARLASGADDLVRAANLADLALTEARDDPGAHAQALAVAAIIDMNLDQPERAQARYAQALALFEQAGDAGGVADILDARAMATFLDGHISAGVAAFDQVARLFEDAGDLLRVVTPRSTRGHGLVFAGSPAAGLADTEAALDLARTLGHPEGEAYAGWHRSEALTACGRAEEAAAGATDALAVAERIGHRGWTATTLRALGVACHARGDLDAAEGAFRRSLASSEHLPLFTSWAHARLALVLVELGRLEEAAAHARQALATGPPLGHYEARLARCEVAVARGEPDAAAQTAHAAALAARGGYHALRPRLLTLSRLAGGADPPAGKRPARKVSATRRR